ENAAIEHGVHPAIWTYENIDYMRAQFKQLGISYDWEREFATCDPSYYKWEQLVFIKMLERGLAYRRRSTVNWCPSCQTVLAADRPKRGLRVRAKIVNPFNDAEIPLFIADYVLMGYGTGAIMAVPGEDQRDWEFAKQHGLPIIETVKRPDGWVGEAYGGDGIK